MRVLSNNGNYNLSPQGDENLSTASQSPPSRITIYPRKGTETHPRWTCTLAHPLQFIPARGRKLSWFLPSCFVVCIVIYPRKGTETRSDLLHSTFCADCNLSPRGGEDAFPLLFTFAKLAISVSPRKGTETYHAFRFSHSRTDCNLSPQGDKKAPLPLAFASSGGALLFLIFYFTGWELRLPESSL